MKLIGPANIAAEIAADASTLYARNLLAFLALLVDKESGTLKIDVSDEIIRATLLTRDGAIVHPQLAAASAA